MCVGVACGGVGVRRGASRQLASNSQPRHRGCAVVPVGGGCTPWESLRLPYDLPYTYPFPSVPCAGPVLPRQHVCQFWGPGDGCEGAGGLCQQVCADRAGGARKCHPHRQTVGCWRLHPSSSLLPSADFTPCCLPPSWTRRGATTDGHALPLALYVAASSAALETSRQ